MPTSLIMLFCAGAAFLLPPPKLFALAAYVLVSSASLAVVASLVLGKVSLLQAAKANLNAFIVGLLTTVGLIYLLAGQNFLLAGLSGLVVGSVAALFIYAYYLETTVLYGLLVYVLSSILTVVCMWLLSGFMGVEPSVRLLFNPD
ncbi:MAG TPA: hypothetical protein VFW42_06450 [Fluviicoccus sp.]|nr:hypothetical protein [Fluviicoccus sp.]